MTLGELIEFLENQHPAKVASTGLWKPNSYRGDYSQLMLEPTANISVARMLEEIKPALGKTYTGYKGGEYTMDEFTDVYIAEWGELGHKLSKPLLIYMIGDIPKLEDYL